MHLSTMPEWLSYIDSLHSRDIDLGLERTRIVAERLQALSFKLPVIIVGGTNGKGSTVAGLESIYRAAGYRTGTFTSPVLFKHNEQVRINHEIMSDQTFCAAFAAVESARKDTPLTPFEFFTLAALWIFKQHVVDVLILEVGLGGRLDAVNILEPDVAVVTSIGIDHVNILGHTREQIGYEKAGIFRQHKPAVCGDEDPPQSLITSAADKHAVLYCMKRDFDFATTSPATWSFYHYTHSLSAKAGGKGWVEKVFYKDLPSNILATQNMATVLMTVTVLQSRLPVTREFIVAGLGGVKLPGRIQIMQGSITEIFDVAHNPAAVALLKQKLATLPCAGRTLAVFSMLADKDIIGSLLSIHEHFDHWHVAPLQTRRAASQKRLQSDFEKAKIRPVTFFPTIADAYQQAKHKAQAGDRIVIFGSFHTVAEVHER